MALVQFSANSLELRHGRLQLGVVCAQNVVRFIYNPPLHITAVCAKYIYIDYMIKQVEVSGERDSEFVVHRILELVHVHGSALPIPREVCILRPRVCRADAMSWVTICASCCV